MIDRKTYLHRRAQVFAILAMLKDFTELHSVDLGPADEMDADEVAVVNHMYESLVAYMEENQSHSRADFEPESEGESAEAAVEVEAELAPPKEADPAKKVLAVARAIRREVKDLEIDGSCLRLAAEYLVYASMALRSMSRDEINSASGDELATITEEILAGPDEDYLENFRRRRV